MAKATFQKAISANNYKNNGGTALNAGTTAAGGKLVSLSVATNTYFPGFRGSRVLDNSEADKAVSSGTFAYNQRSAREMTIFGFSTTIGGVSNTSLKIPASKIGSSIQQSTHPFKRNQFNDTAEVALRNGQWNEVSGSFNPSLPTAGSGFAFATDDALTAGRSAPGEFAYTDGSPLPKQADYSVKTGP